MELMNDGHDSREDGGRERERGRGAAAAAAQASERPKAACEHTAGVMRRREVSPWGWTIKIQTVRKSVNVCLVCV